MPQEGMSEDEVRRTLLELARLLFGPGVGPVSVLALRGDFALVSPASAPPPPPGQEPTELAGYDAAIVRALTARPMSSPRLARAAGHRANSYFRQRLAALVEAGYVRHTRRGYNRPDR